MRKKRTIAVPDFHEGAADFVCWLIYRNYIAYLTTGTTTTIDGKMDEETFEGLLDLFYNEEFDADPDAIITLRKALPQIS